MKALSSALIRVVEPEERPLSIKAACISVVRQTSDISCHSVLGVRRATPGSTRKTLHAAHACLPVIRVAMHHFESVKKTSLCWPGNS